MPTLRYPGPMKNASRRSGFSFFVKFARVAFSVRLTLFSSASGVSAIGT
jgi:hypothetical protein